MAEGFQVPCGFPSRALRKAGNVGREELERNVTHVPCIVHHLSSPALSIPLHLAS